MPAFELLAGVSIHAPARGATIHRQRRGVARAVSIHAPARGATSSPCAPRSCGEFDPRPRTRGDEKPPGGAAVKRFRSTPPHEGRPARQLQVGGRQRVSIHAPARGATGAIRATRRRAGVSIHAPARGATAWTTSRCSLGSSFDPRPRTRGDSGCGSSFTAPARFDPRPRTRGDLPQGCRHVRRRCFDPRPRTRGDVGLDRRCRQLALVSIHAPARGATRRRRDPGGQPGFRSTPPHEGRLDAVGQRGVEAGVSIHAPARGATDTSTIWWPCWMFRSTPPHEGRPPRR